MSLKNPYATFLDSLEKPARYIGGEHFIQRKSWGESEQKNATRSPEKKVLGTMALCFPDTYEIGMSHLGMKVLYDEVNKAPDLLAERCFAPWIDMEKQLRERQLPLVTLESFRPLSDFHVVGFSLQYEMSYSNILNMLDLGGISVWQKDRAEHEPFITCGGPCAMHPEPLAPFMDFVVIGDGEKLLPEIVRYIQKARVEGKSRQEILVGLGQWVGIYVPSLYDVAIDENSGLQYVSGAKAEYKGVIADKVSRHIIPSLKDYPFPTESPIPHMTAIFDRFSVELARGCTEGCRFCQAGMIYRPVRERAPEKVVDMVMQGIKSGGFDEASLTCLSTADYSAVTPLILDLLDKISADRSTLGISSLRAYGLDERILDKLASVKNTSLTFAPEAGSQRMRNVINKNVSEEDMLKTAHNVFSRGWSKMKLYFMIGLPTEEDEDVQAIMETAKKARDIGKHECGVRNASVTVSVSSFVPKPHTPFQWSAMITLDEIIRKQNLLFDLSKQYRLNFRKHFSKISHLEGIVARGDRRVADIIFKAWQRGARFDGWDETFKFDLWMEVIEESGLDVSLMLGTIPLNAKLPWDHIDVGLEPRFLEIEWKKALHNRLSPPCGKVAGAIVHDSNLEALSQKFDIDKKKLVCYHCGVKCDLKGMIEERREFLTTMKAYKSEEYVAPVITKTTILENREKRRPEDVGFRYRVEFSKIGAISFVSHLDLQKIMARIIKRCELPVLYSEGYKPRPLIAFGPALTLGISSLTEYFDVRFAEKIEDEEKFLETLQQHSEQGIIFKRVSLIDQKAPSIQQMAQEFTYFLPVKDSSDSDSAVALANKVAEQLLAKSEIPIESYSKKDQKMKSKDIRQKILSMQVAHLDLSQEQLDLIDEVSPCKDRIGFFIRTQVDHGSSIRPSELMDCLQRFGVKVERPIKVAQA